MGKCFLHGNGSNPLNINITAYSTGDALHADAPKENTIGVVTDNYKGYVFCGSEPVNPTEGLLWIQLDTKSPFKFPATNRNVIFIHPIKCWKYVNFAWEAVESYLYQEGKWNVFGRLYLYHNLQFNKHVVDERWGMSGCMLGYSSTSATPLKSGTNSYGFEIDATKAFAGNDASLGSALVFKEVDTNLSDGIVPSARKFDLTNYKTLVFKGLFEYENSNSSVIYGVWEKLETNYQQNLAASAIYTQNNTEDVTIDVSALEGEYYIGVGVRSCRVRIEECYLEM